MILEGHHDIKYVSIATTRQCNALEHGASEDNPYWTGRRILSGSPIQTKKGRTMSVRKAKTVAGTHGTAARKSAAKATKPVSAGSNAKRVAKSVAKAKSKVEAKRPT